MLQLAYHLITWTLFIHAYMVQKDVICISFFCLFGTFTEGIQFSCSFLCCISMFSVRSCYKVLMQKWNYGLLPNELIVNFSDLYLYFVIWPADMLIWFGMWLHQPIRLFISYQCCCCSWIYSSGNSQQHFPYNVSIDSIYYNGTHYLLSRANVCIFSDLYTSLFLACSINY